ncbi:MAG: sel1 repeat family protein [Bacteroidaceae bacterium]|nr:sel1 repeat family protein [Bacteroidaceae bacterium]
MKKIVFFIGLLVFGLTFVSCSSDTEKADKLCLEYKYDEAFSLYQKAADAGNAYAMWKLSSAYRSGEGVEVCLEKAYDFLKKAADNGSEEATIDMARSNIFGFYNTTPDTVKAIKTIKELEKNSKNSYVRCRIAGLYYDGVGEQIKQDRDKAFELLNSVENKEEPYYLYLMGYIYCYGTDRIDVDDAKAIQYWEKAFANGRMGAGLLGQLYQFGGAKVQKDIDTAIEWYKKGAEGIGTYSMLNLARIYTSTDSTLQKYHNEKEALSLVRKAMRHGDGDAYDILGCWYAEGFIVEKDDAKAFECFVKADEYESINGTLNLGTNFLTGRGCERDLKKAEQLWLKAANKGSAEAARRLGNSYADGTFGSNLEKFNFYMEKAAKLGSPGACYQLAMNYYNGQNGYKQDSYQAFVYSKKAADLGVVDAYEAVAYMYENGIGCDKNPQKAKEYRNKKQ